MPLPTPKQGETRSEFITRCMDNDTMQSEFPEPEQRTAVCVSQWERRQSTQAASRWIVQALAYPSAPYPGIKP